MIKRKILNCTTVGLFGRYEKQLWRFENLFHLSLISWKQKSLDLTTMLWPTSTLQITEICILLESVLTIIKCNNNMCRVHYVRCLKWCYTEVVQAIHHYKDIKVKSGYLEGKVLKCPYEMNTVGIFVDSVCVCSYEPPNQTFIQPICCCVKSLLQEGR